MSMSRTKFCVDMGSSPENHSNFATSAPEVVSRESRVVSESSSRTRSVPMHVEAWPWRLNEFDVELDPYRTCSFPASAPLAAAPRPMTVRWDYSPNTISPEQQLQHMDREFQRLAREMSHLYTQTQSGTIPPPPPPTQVYYHPSDRHYSSAVERVLNQQDPYLLASQPISRSRAEIVPATLWEANAHADTWRKKENFHIDNPVVKSRDGRSQFRLEFDLRQFNPDEIQVTTDDVTRLLTVQARHEEESDGRKAKREYYRQCTIPRDVEPRSIVSKLTKTGILTVNAPLALTTEQLTREDETFPIMIKHAEH